MVRSAVLLASLAALWGCGESQHSTSSLKFSAGEHVIIGDRGYKNACGKRSECQPSFARADGLERYSYGELIAFSADFYENSTELFREKREPWYQLFRNNIDSTRKLFQEEMQAAQKLMDGHSDTEYPDFSKGFALNYRNYINLAENNEEHFGFYNIKRYVAEHEQALALALRAHDLRQKGDTAADEALREALFQAAFADHFLTDGFASGHIRNPRRQTLAWAESHGYSRRTAAAFSKILHDRDGEIRQSGEHGLAVRNARGDEWFARCDSQLFYKNSGDGRAVQMVTEAVEISLDEFFSTYDSGVVPEGKFPALDLVPYPADESVGLTEAIRVDRFLPQKAYDAMAWYLHPPFVKDFSPGAITGFYKSLPEVMDMMRHDIDSALAADPNLVARLPDAYALAYRNIR